MADSFFDPLGGGSSAPSGGSPPTNTEILDYLRPWDGSGTGVFGKMQAKAAIKTIPNLGFSDAEIDELLSTLEATSGGRIHLEPLAQQVAFEAARKMRRGGPPATETSPKQMNTGLSIAVFDEAGHATQRDPDKPPSPSYSGSLNSPGTVMGLPEWYGSSFDRDLSPGPPKGNPAMFPRSASADPFQVGGASTDPHDIFGLPSQETRDDSHLNKSTTQPEPTGFGLIAPPRQKSAPGTPSDQAHQIGWGRQQSVEGGHKKKKKKKRKKKAGSREPTPEPGDDEAMSPEDDLSPTSPYSGPDSPEPTPEPGEGGDEKEQQQQNVDALAEMKRGTAMLKYGRRGFPHFRRFQISADNSRLLWFSKKKATADTSVLIQDIVDVKEGQQTEVFKQCTQPALERASFSIIYGTTYKTLDVVAKSREEAQMWVKGIRVLAQHARTGTLDSVNSIPVLVNFTDITKPRYREQMGSKKKPVGPYNNPELTRVIQRNLDQCKQRYQALVQMTNTDQLRHSEEYENVRTLLAEMEERLEDVQLGLTQKSAPLSSLKRDTWVIKVDITVLEEKVKVINRGG